MNNTVTLTKLSAFDAIKLKFELDAAGLIHNQDYTWTYHPIKYEDGWHIDSHVHFEFVNAALASFYQLKWTK